MLAKVLRAEFVSSKKMLKQGGSRLIALEVWDVDDEADLPVERLKLYKFSTDSFMCGGFEPFTDFLGKDLVNPGEELGVFMMAI